MEHKVKVVSKLCSKIYSTQVETDIRKRLRVLAYIIMSQIRINYYKCEMCGHKLIK